MKIILTIASLVLFTTATLAQNTGRVTGNVFQNEKPANGATVYLLKSKDSSVVKLSMAGKEGSYSFEQVAGGTYLVAVTSTGYQKTFSVPFEFIPGQQEIQVSPIHLIPASSSLTGIVVTASRPLIEQKIDRTIVNVDASITNIGTSALEVLEKSPGVMVDRDGNISLKGKDGVLIMVDGRPTQLSGPDLTNLLQNLNSSQLDQIEIMTNPPARYDAAGTAGVINIKTKKIIAAGLNGSAMVSYGQGKYPKTNEAFNFNYRKGSLNLFTNLSHIYQQRYSKLWFDRNILNSDNDIENIFSQEATRIGTGKAFNAKLGVDFFASTKTTLGAIVNLNSRNIISNNPNTTYISNASNELESITRAMVDNTHSANSLSANLNFRNVLDKKGREISSDIDYVKHTSGNDLFMVNSYTDAAANPYQKADSLTGDLPQEIDVYSARIDYVHPIKKDVKFEAGIKSSLVSTDNNARYDSILNGSIIQDFNRSNHFVYEENINAAYVNLNASLSKKITAQLGLRLENTNAKGRQKSTGENFDRHYIENIFSQEATRIGTGKAFNVKLGVDFFASTKTTLGAIVNLNSRNIISNNPNTTYISNASNELESITRAMVDNTHSANSLSANLNFRNVLDKKGREISSDIDYVKHTSGNDLFMVNSYTDAAANPYQKADSLTGDLPQEIDVYSARIDYVHPIKKDVKFEAGIKSSLVSTDNNARYDSILNGSIIQDFNRSNHFVYEENINAAYVNLNASLSKKITAQLGLRLENTNAKGRQKSTGENFDRHYTQLFPTAYFQYKANDQNIIGANFSRRVQRPSYQSLNPFIRFIDRYTYSLGNPNLKPSISNNIEFSHSWKNKVTTTLNYTYVKDIIQSIIQQKGREAYNTPDNVSSLKQYGISVNANLPVTKWWTSNTYFNVSNDEFEGIINNTLVNLKATGVAVNATQQFKISKSFAAELTGMYRSGRLEGIMRVKPLFIMGAGISQKVLKNKGTIRLSARDIFHTQRLRGKSQYSNVDFSMRQVSETQVLTLGFTYNFSKGKKIAPVKRTAGSADEEQDRIGE